MPKMLTELLVFVSSPSDLNGERLLVERAIESVSSVLKSTHGVTLRAMKWEKDVVPGLGQSAQSVINSQVDDNYDIYIGLLGTYFGTATTSYSSGTEEEFQHAYARYVNNPADLRVLFYFKTTIDNVFSLDTDQFEKVRSFREQIRGTALWGSFSDGDNLLKVLTDHLKQLVEQQWGGDEWKVLSPIKAEGEIVTSENALSKTEAECDIEEEVDGFLELISIATEYNSRISEVMEEMTKDAGDFQSALALRAVQIETAGSSGKTADQIECYDLVATDMLAFDKRLRYMIPQMSTALEGSLEFYLRLRNVISSEFSALSEQFNSSTASVKQLPVTIRQTRDLIENLRNMINQIPPFTKRLRFARKQLSGAFDLYIASVTIFISKAEGSLDVDG